MSVLSLFHRDFAPAAFFRRVFAARMERASLRQMGRIGGHPLNRMKPHLVLVHIRNRAEKPDSIRVGRMIENLLLRAVFDDITSINHSYVIAGLRNNAHVMRNQQCLP